jgi:16S rRNA C1402 N4-methylase RsmH
MFSFRDCKSRKKMKSIKMISTANTQISLNKKHPIARVFQYIRIKINLHCKTLSTSTASTSVRIIKVKAFTI